uniref:Uncharacterized protein n=1 Tax=Caenorhabditis tropicalis TaxID=1561998 RepID=A0A1I7TBW9_9PELO
MDQYTLGPLIAQQRRRGKRKSLTVTVSFLIIFLDSIRFVICHQGFVKRLLWKKNSKYRSENHKICA